MASIDTGTLDKLQKVLGTFDENIKIITQELGVLVHVDGTVLSFDGEGAEVAAAVAESLLKVIDAGEEIDRTRLTYCIELARDGNAAEIEGVMKGVVAITAKGKPVKCKTVGQKKYVEAVGSHTVTFGVGPAGTGKTYLAVCLAVAAYKGKQLFRF